MDRLPAWVVDDEVMEVWRTGSEDAPQSFRGWEVKKAEWGQVLMLSWSPSRITGGPASPVAKVFTAVVVCIHPCQVVMSVKDAANDLLRPLRHHADEEHERHLSTTQVLGGNLLPKSIESFIPSPALPRRLWWSEGGMPGPLGGAQHMVVRCLHQRQTSGGDEAVLPPIYSKDPGVPGTLEVGYLGPLWENSQYTTAVPAGGTGLRGVRPAISEVTFCPDEKNAHRSLALMQGEGIIYFPKWYDKSGKPLENSNAVQPNDLSEVPLDRDSELGGDEPDNEVTSAPPVPNDVVSDGSDKDDAKSREASGAGSDSGSGSSGSGSSSGSEDSSQDSASSRSGSGEGDAQGDAPRHKVRQKKKPHQSFNAESDEQSAPKVTTDKTGGNADGETKRSSQDSGLGDGATAHPVTGSSGAGVAGRPSCCRCRGNGSIAASHHPALHGYFGGVNR